MSRLNRKLQNLVMEVIENVDFHDTTIITLKTLRNLFTNFTNAADFGIDEENLHVYRLTIKIPYNVEYLIDYTRVYCEAFGLFEQNNIELINKIDILINRYGIGKRIRLLNVKHVESYIDDTNYEENNDDNSDDEENDDEFKDPINITETFSEYHGELNENDTCPICINQLKIDTFELNSCKHKFCSKCIELFKINDMYKCPCCRQSILN